MAITCHHQDIRSECSDVVLCSKILTHTEWVVSHRLLNRNNRNKRVSVLDGVEIILVLNKDRLVLLLINMGNIRLNLT